MPDPTLDLDPNAILGSLGVTNAGSVTPVLGGIDTALWRVTTPDAGYALRVLRPGLFNRMRVEVAAMAAAAATVPVPAVVATADWRDHPVLLLEWCPGRPMVTALQAAPRSSHRLGRALGRTQARLHKVAAPEPLTDQPERWLDWADPDDDLRAKLLRRAQGRTALLHLDFHPANVLVDGATVTAVVDWANAMAGDPRADLARTRAILELSSVDPGAPRAVVLRARRDLLAGLHLGYREVAGPVVGMAPFYAWAGAVMIRDLAPRLGRTDIPWLTPAFFDQVRAWTAAWRARAGLPA